MKVRLAKKQMKKARPYWGKVKVTGLGARLR